MAAFAGADGAESQTANEHGGDLGTARAMFPGAPEPFLDLSTGINPNPYPVPPLSGDIWAKLPDAGGHERLIAAAVAAYGAPSPVHIVPAPGTQILLPLVFGLVPPGRAAVLAPTYLEHARAAALAGHGVTEVADIGVLGGYRLAVVTNPNNPDGRLVAKEELLALAKKLRTSGGLLVIDEAFMDIGRERASLAGEVGCGNVVVLRSFGKFFGLAGLRLGFALAAPALAARISALLGPWSVSGPALTIGAQALADGAWIGATRDRLTAAATRLDAILAAAGLDIVGGTALYRLAQSPAAGALFHQLGQAGIFVRRFRDHPQWLRFGLPSSELDWQRLQTAMARFGDKARMQP